jgi:biopolymer transport protein TolR
MAMNMAGSPGGGRRGRRRPVMAEINVTPMVDVMLVLLIIFMVITPLLQNKVQIDLAQANNSTLMPDADKEDAVVVAITRDGGVFLGPNKVDPSQLGSLVRDMLADKTDKTIFVRADARAQFKSVEDAIDDVRTAGVETVNLLTARRDNTQVGGQ